MTNVRELCCSHCDRSCNTDFLGCYFGSTEIKKIVMHVFPLIFRTSVREAFSQYYNVNNAVNITDVKINYLIILQIVPLTFS